MKIHISLNPTSENFAELLDALGQTNEGMVTAMTLDVSVLSLPDGLKGDLHMRGGELSLRDDGNAILDVPEDWREQHEGTAFEHSTPWHEDTSHERLLENVGTPLLKDGKTYAFESLFIVTTERGDLAHIHKDGSYQTWCGRDEDEYYPSYSPGYDNRLCKACVKNAKVHDFLDAEMESFLGIGTP